MRIERSVATTAPASDGASEYTLLVLGEEVTATYALPSGSVVVGRSPDCGVQVDDPSVSRRHARLVVGDVIVIEDLGSANGTHVAAGPVTAGATAVVSPGEAIRIGSAIAVVQRRSPERSVHRVLPHDYFELRLAEECARAERTGGGFAVGRVRVAAGAGDELAAALLAGLRPDDVIAGYAPRELEVLLPGSTLDDARTVLAAVAGQVRHGQVAVGLASFGRDGRTADALIAAAAPAGTGGVELATPAPGPIAGELGSLRALVERVARGEADVLVQGEAGAGKEVVAIELHRLSKRAAHAMARVDCAAPDAAAVLERALAAGRGGTVLLDEIGELPPAAQAMLARLLAQRAPGVRLVATTRRDLDAAVARDRFRVDLLRRLGARLQVPPLRERRGEIVTLAATFVTDACARIGRTTPPRLAAGARAALEGYGWPGNVRELRNVIDRAVELATGELVEVEHLPREKMRAGVLGERPRRTSPSLAAAPAPAAPPPSAFGNDFRGELRALERQRIIDALARCGGNQSKAAALIGVPRRTFLKRLDAYGIARPRKRRES